MENSDNRRTPFLMLIILFNIYAVPVYPEAGLQAHLRKANLREKQHDFPGAIKHFKNALEIDPQCVEAHIQLGGIYLKMGKIGEAIESYSYALQLHPSAPATHDNLSAITHYNLGLILARRGDFEKAKAQYQLAIQLAPNQSFAHYQFGYALAQQRQFAQAIPFYKRAIQLYPNNTAAYYQLANAHFRLGNQQEGKRQLENFREIQAKQRFHIAEDALKSGKVHQAIRSYNRALDMDAEFAPAYARLGAIAFQADELENARQYLQRALEIDPDFTAAHYQLGWVYHKRGEFEKAIEAFQKSIALRPDSAPACNTLAMLYLEQDQHLDDALVLAKRAVKSKPIAAYWDTLAYACYKKQRYEQAAKAIEKALELQPNDPEYLARQKTIQERIAEQNE